MPPTEILYRRHGSAIMTSRQCFKEKVLKGKPAIQDPGCTRTISSTRPRPPPAQLCSAYVVGSSAMTTTDAATVICRGTRPACLPACLPSAVPPFRPSVVCSFPPFPPLLVAWLVIDAGCGGGEERREERRCRGGGRGRLEWRGRGEAGRGREGGRPLAELQATNGMTNEPGNQRKPAASSPSRGWPATRPSLRRSLGRALGFVRLGRDGRASISIHAGRERGKRKDGWTDGRVREGEGREGSGEATRENRGQRDPPRALPTSNFQQLCRRLPLIIISPLLDASSSSSASRYSGESEAERDRGRRELESSRYTAPAEPFPSSLAHG